MSLLTIYHLGQALLSAYTGIFSYTSIRKVQTYEEPTQKAAQYSNVADHHLQTTRSTMAAGAGSVLISLTTSAYLLTTSTSKEETTTVTPLLLSTVIAIALTAAYTHVGNYWRGKWKVPLPKSGDYNDAITSANQMRTLIGGLAVSWGVAAVWYFFKWVS